MKSRFLTPPLSSIFRFPATKTTGLCRKAWPVPFLIRKRYRHVHGLRPSFRGPGYIRFKRMWFCNRSPGDRPGTLRFTAAHSESVLKTNLSEFPSILSQNTPFPLLIVPPYKSEARPHDGPGTSSPTRPIKTPARGCFLKSQSLQSWIQDSSLLAFRGWALLC